MSNLINFFEEFSLSETDMTDKFEEFNEDVEDSMERLRRLFNGMPDKGNSRIECQKKELLFHLCQLQYAVNGLTPEDLCKD